MKKVFEAVELTVDTVIKKYLITAADGKSTDRFNEDRRRPYRAAAVIMPWVTFFP